MVRTFIFTDSVRFNLTCFHYSNRSNCIDPKSKKRLVPTLFHQPTQRPPSYSFFPTVDISCYRTDSTCIDSAWNH